VEKAGLIGLVKMRLLMSDEELSLGGKALRDAIADDKQRGLIPFYVRLNCIVSPCDFVPTFSRGVYVFMNISYSRTKATFANCAIFFRDSYVHCILRVTKFMKME